MMGDWTFFSNYGHVLVCLTRNREARLRDVAEEVGITERAVQKIVRDLQEAGYLDISKQGRCNRYRINRRKSLRHGLESQCTVGKLLSVVTRSAHQEDADIPAGRVLPASEQSKPRAGTKPAAEKMESAGPPAAADAREQGSLF